jgi:hypothetical protein
MFSVKGYSFAPELFSQGFAQGSGPCGCTSHCCSSGVYVDVKERDSILARKDAIKRQMDETQSTDETLWFETEESDDADFASGRCVGTTVVNGKCAFLNARGHCAIQLAAVASGLDRWAWKPLYCILFPIEISSRVVGFDPMLQNEKPCCSIRGEFEVPLFRACKDELVFLLGEDGYHQLEEHYRGLAKENSSSNI